MGAYSFISLPAFSTVAIKAECLESLWKFVVYYPLAYRVSIQIVSMLFAVVIYMMQCEEIWQDYITGGARTTDVSLRGVVGKDFYSHFLFPFSISFNFLLSVIFHSVEVVFAILFFSFWVTCLGLMNKRPIAIPTKTKGMSFSVWMTVDSILSHWYIIA
jgi:hypothetical protein